MGFKKTDNSEAIKAAARGAIDAGLTRAAIVLQRSIKRAFGSEGGRVIGKTHTGRNIYGAARPGRFPGIRTGKLRQSIYATPGKGQRAAVGTNVRYGKWLERGTKRMRPRPWLLRSARRERVAMEQEFCKTVSRNLAASIKGGTR